MSRSAGILGVHLHHQAATLFNPSHRFDVEARDPDKLRDPLGAGTTLAASFGVGSSIASGPAGLSCPGGIGAQPRVHAQGPREAGSGRDEPSTMAAGRAASAFSATPP